MISPVEVSGCVHTNVFSLGFIFSEAENAQHLSVDTTVFMNTIRLCFLFKHSLSRVFSH